MNAPLRDKSYFDARATSDMAKHLRNQSRTTQETMAYACRILAMTEQEAGLAGQISVRSERPGAYWTLRFGLGFDEATPADFIEVDRDLNTLTGEGMATRRHASTCGSTTRGPTSIPSFIPIRRGQVHWQQRNSLL